MVKNTLDFFFTWIFFHYFHWNVLIQTYNRADFFLKQYSFLFIFGLKKSKVAASASRKGERREYYTFVLKRVFLYVFPGWLYLFVRVFVCMYFRLCVCMCNIVIWVVEFPSRDTKLKRFFFPKNEYSQRKLFHFVNVNNLELSIWKSIFVLRNNGIFLNLFC